MKKFLPYQKTVLHFFSILCVMLFSTFGWGQQVIGSFPNMNGGFEGQTAGAIAQGNSTSLWTKQSSALNSTISTTTPRTGTNKGLVTLSETNATRFLSSPSGPATPVNVNFIASTSYVMQMYVKNSTTIPNFQTGFSVNGTASGNYSTAVTLPINSDWTKISYVKSSSSTAITSNGYGVPIRSFGSATIEFDDFVIYAGTAADATAPNPSTSPTIPSAAATQQTISWTAPGTGVDGGGYMVVRSTADPTTTPNANGIYAIGNFVAGTEQVVYIGTATSFIDLGLTASTQYYYRIYTVDKAFNYSTSIAVSGTTSAPSFADEPATQASGISFANVTSTSFDINWTAVSGTNSLVIVKEGSAVNANPGDGDTLVPNTAFGSGVQLGTGNYVVYNSTSNSVSITGLLKARTYYVKVYSFNGSAGSENYLITSPASNSQFTLPGEITSAQSGAWGTGTTWVGGAAPTQYDNVTIGTSHTVDISTTSTKCYNLAIPATSTVWSPSGKTLQIYGTSLACDGTFGDALTANSQLILEFGGNLTISGTGNIYPFRIRPVPSLSNIGVTFDANVTCTNTTAGVVFDNGSNDNVSVTVNAGKTVTIAGNFNSNSSSTAVGAGNATINVFGTITIAGNLSPAVALGKTCTFTVKNGGLITADRFYLSPAHQVQAATYTVEAGGKIEVNGTNGQAVDCSSTTFTSAVVGAGTFSATSGVAVFLANASGLNATTGPIRTTTRTFDVNNTFNFAGTAAQETGGYLPATVGNLTINNAAGVTLGANTTVNGLLTLTSGIFSKGSSAITLGSAATIVRTAGSLDAAPTFGATVNVRYNGATAISSGVEIPTETSVLKDLTIATTASAVVTLASATSLNNKLTVTSGSLNSNGFLILKSSECCTAFVGELAAGAVTGDVTVERYIPMRRAWRALTAPVVRGTNNSVFFNWQNGGNPIANTGVEIWSNNPQHSSVTNGGSGSSMLSYSSSGNSWSGVTDTSTTNLFSSTINNPFMVFVTGPYAIASTRIASGAAATTLKATGSLLIGNQNYASLAGKYTFIGNPYASPLSLSTMLTDNPDFEQNIWVWDANATVTNSVGTYNLFNEGTYTNTTTNPAVVTGTLIQSGQAFFVKSAAVGSFVIKETQKGTTNSNAVFRDAAPAQLLRVGLYKQINTEWSGRDGAMTVILADANANQTPNKMANGTENVAFTKNSGLFASNHQLPLVASDVLNVKVWNTTAGANYKLKINTERFATTSLNATLEDLFTNSRTPLTLNGSAVEYPFAVTTEAASTGNRFRIVFENSALGINNPKATGISILPNPITGDTFQVNFGTLGMGTYSYSICNTLGQEVEKGSLNNETQNTNSVVKFKNNTATGLYIMKVTGIDNTVFTIKIIKK